MEIFIVSVCLPLLGINAKMVSCDFLSLFFSFIKIKINKIGGLEIGEQTILMNFYNSLTSNGTLNWNVSNDLCGQTGVTCDSSIPKRVIQLYSFYFVCCCLNKKNEIEI